MQTRTADGLQRAIQKFQELREMVEPLLSVSSGLQELQKAIDRCTEFSTAQGNLLKQQSQSLTLLQEQVQEMQPTVSDIEVKVKDYGKVDRLIDESNQLWQFYQKFIDEQGLDQIKFIRNKDTDMTTKLMALEWMIRYMEFLTPDLLQLAIQTFREIYLSNARAQQYIEHMHSVEAVPTVLTSLEQTLRRKDSQKIGIDNYDQLNAVLLMALEPIIINNKSLDDFTQMDGMADVARIMMEQPMPNEIGQKFDKGFVRSSFYYSLRVLATATRTDDAARRFMDDKKWALRIIDIVQQWRDLEVIANSTRVLNRILQSPEAASILLGIKPKLASILLVAMADHIENKAALFELV